jgi:tetratricopeptide (TPR) repeat protein
MATGNYEEALKDANEIVRQSSHKVKGYKLRFKVNQLLKNSQEAMADANKIIHLRPLYYVGYNFRCGLYLQQKNYAKALQDADQEILLAPHHVGGYIHRLEIKVALHNYADALKEAQKIINLDPLSSVGYYLYAETLRKGRQYDEALTYLQKLEAADLFGGNMRLTRAYCNLVKGDLEKTYADLQFFSSSEHELKRLKNNFFDSQIRLWCAYLFVIDSRNFFAQKEEFKKQALESARRAAYQLRRFPSKKIGVFQWPDYRRAIEISKKYQLNY